jgi:gentisate 1,2-dioxygenase
VLEGQIVALVGDAVVEVDAGSFLLKPSGVMHAFGNPGTEPARVYELHAPGGLEEFYAFMHRNASNSALTDDERHASFKETCQEYGLVQHWDIADEVRERLGL